MTDENVVAAGLQDPGRLLGTPIAAPVSNYYRNMSKHPGWLGSQAARMYKRPIPTKTRGFGNRKRAQKMATFRAGQR